MGIFRAVSPCSTWDRAGRICLLCESSSLDDMVLVREALKEGYEYDRRGYRKKAKPEKVICADCVKAMAEALGIAESVR